MKKFKKIWKKYNFLIIALFFVLLFVLLSFLIQGNDEEKEFVQPNIEDYEVSEEVKEWVEEANSEKYVLTVMAASSCYWCQQFSPIFESVMEEYDITYYWYELDSVEGNDDYAAITEMYDDNFKGSTPYTMLTYNGEFIDDISGYVEEADLIEFLKNNEVIK